MTTDEALRVGAEACLIAPSAHGVDVIRITRDFRRPSSEYDEAAAALDKLREQLGRDRDALRKVREEMAQVVQRIQEDERFHYPPADTDVNAPLALIQVEMKARYHLAKRWLAALDAILAEEP